MTPKQLKKHLDDNYGHCELDGNEVDSPHCTYLRSGWIGNDCPHWVPTGATTWAELRQHNAEQRRQMT